MIDEGVKEVGFDLRPLACWYCEEPVNYGDPVIYMPYRTDEAKVVGVLCHQLCVGDRDDPQSLADLLVFEHKTEEADLASFIASAQSAISVELAKYFPKVNRLMSEETETKLEEALKLVVEDQVRGRGPKL